MTNLSVVIISKNEAHNIERCIKSCLSLGAEIIVLDSNSTDHTVSLAKALGAQVHNITWQGYGATKNEGAQRASHQWVLSLDADEALSEELIEAIKQNINSPKGFDAFWLPRSLILNGQELFYGAVKGEVRLRLYNKNKLRWNLKEVHEDLEKIDKKQAVFYGELEGRILHYSYRDAKDMEERLDKYALLSAKKLSGKGAFYLYFKKYFAPSFSFIKNYYFKKGYADGANGKLFAQAQAAYVRNKYTYALEVVSSEQ